MIAHLGVAALVFGVTMVRTHEIERDVRLRPGDRVEFADHVFTFHGVRQVEGSNYRALQGRVEVTRGGRVVAELYPEKRNYRVQRMAMTEAAIDTSLTRDLYVSLGEVVDGDAWIVRVYVKPYIVWIWGGCFLMAFGGLLAASDRRYRSAARQPATVPRGPAAQGVGT
jgi:cytochrome c-type biogenesis protein CcmF